MTKNLAAERKRAGLNQRELADKLGCSVKSLSLYENNVREIPPNIAVAAADLFGCSTDYLYDRTDERLPRYVPGERQA